MVGLLALAVTACGGSEPEVEPTATVTPVASEAEDSGADPGGVATTGDTVRVHYKGTLDNGEVFDSSEGRDPLEFVLGQGEVISGFDDAVDGMNIGDTKTIRLEPEDAYGERREELVVDVPRDQAPEGIEVGSRLRLANGGLAEVVDISDSYVRIDANHPLAGNALTFEIELVDVE